MESFNISAAQISPAQLSDLRQQISGRILIPADDAYESARHVWNGMTDRRPALIVQCQSVNDVRLAVKTARLHHLPIAIRGGGHNAAGNGVCDDGIVIDFSQMRNVQVDPEQMTARAQPGATWGDFDKATQAFGLATTGGLISTTGIAGLTLGGGVGWLVRRFGMSCDNLVSADVVTADGDLVTASTTENEELFWGLRGGGGNFGVVTSLTYRLHPVANVLGGMILYPRSEAKNVIRRYRDFMQTAPDELTMYAALIHTPDGVPVVGLLACYSGDLQSGTEVLKPMRELGAPLADTLTELPYLQMQTMLDAGFPHGNRYYWKSGFLEALTDDAIETILRYGESVPSPLTPIILELYGGQANREPEGGTAYPHRQSLFDLVIISNWVKAEDDEKNIAWTRSLFNAMEPWLSNRVYVNALGTEGDDRVRDAYGANYERLQNLKRKYDPENIFHINQNIKP